MIIHDVNSRGAMVSPNDDEHFRGFVFLDTIEDALKWIRNDANVSGSAQLTTGITVYEDQATDLRNLIYRARAKKGRAS